MSKGYLGWRGVIKLAKELGYSWQEACEVLYKKKINPKTTFDQILICARIKYELEFIKSGGFLTNYKDGRIIKPNMFENEIHYIVRANFSIFKEFLIKRSKLKINTERSRVDYSRHVYWCNPFEPINKGKLGTTQGWRIEKPVKQYY
jgi:hypothetical protein